MSCCKCSVFRIRKACKVLVMMLIPDANTDTLYKYQFWYIVLILILDTGNSIHTDTNTWYLYSYQYVMLVLILIFDTYFDAWYRYWYSYRFLIMVLILMLDSGSHIRYWYLFQNYISITQTTFFCWVKHISTMQRSSNQVIMLRFNVMTIL